MGATFELLQAAAVCLAQSGTVKDRLAQAYQRHLSQLDPVDLPAELRGGFLKLAEAMQRATPLPRENVALASIRKMSMEEAGRHAVFVVQMLGAVAARRLEPSGATAEPLALKLPNRAPVVHWLAAAEA